MSLRVSVLPAAGLQCHRWFCGLRSNKIAGVNPGAWNSGVPFIIGRTDLRIVVLGTPTLGRNFWGTSQIHARILDPEAEGGRVPEAG